MSEILFIGWLAVGWCAGVIAHEFGHTVAAWALGYYVARISIGIGPVIFRMPFGLGAGLVVHAVPVMGYVQTIHPAAPHRFRHILQVFGGVAANAVVYALIVAVEAHSLAPATVMRPIGIAQLMLVAVALLPQQVRVRDVGVITSDGLHIMQAIFRWKPEDPLLPQRILTHLDEQAACLPVPPLPPDAVRELAFHLGRKDHSTDADARREMVERLLHLVSTGQLAGPLEGVALDFVVENELLLGGTGLTPESLDAYSARAMALLPVPCVQATRGCVLVALGHLASGTALLTAAMDADKRFHVGVLGHAFLGLAAAHRNDRSAAADLMATARNAVEQNRGKPDAATFDLYLRRIEAMATNL